MLQMPLHTWFVGAHWRGKNFPALPGFNYWFPTCRRLAPDFALFPAATGIHTHRYHSVLTKKREVGRYRSTERADTWGHYFKRIRAARGLLHLFTNSLPARAEKAPRALCSRSAIAEFGLH